MNKFLRGLLSLVLLVQGFYFSPIAHAEGFFYSRTPSGSTISNPVTVHITGVFGVDFCDSTSSAFQITAGQYPIVATIGFLSGVAQGTMFDQDFTATLPLNTYSGVYITCFGGSQTTTQLDGSFSMLAVAPDLWQQGVVGQSFLLQLQAGGGVEPYTWSIMNGTLPIGLVLDVSNGHISGTPTTIGSYPVTVQAQDALGGTVTKDYALAVYPSVGGFYYSRTPSGSTVSSPVTIHLKGVFGADFCDSSSNSFQMTVGQYPIVETITYQGGIAQGSVIDQDFTAAISPQTYSGIYILCFGGSQGQRTSQLEDLVTIASNQPPVLAPIGDKVVGEGQTLSFVVSAIDSDGDTLTYSATNLPAGATFDPMTHTFIWMPTYGQAGNYPNVEFTVTDNGTPMMLADEMITISVGHVNRSPVFASVGPQQASTTVPVSFSVSATDPDNDTVGLSVVDLPSGALFNPGSGAFSWTPAYNQAGVYTVTFTATDNGTPVVASSVLGVVISVSVSSPTILTESLISDLTSSGLPTNQVNSYLANLRKIVIFVNDGKVQAAINQFDAFIQKVNQDYFKGKLTQVQRDNFVAQAQSIISALQ